MMPVRARTVSSSFGLTPPKKEAMPAPELGHRWTWYSQKDQSEGSWGQLRSAWNKRENTKGVIICRDISPRSPWHWRTERHIWQLITDESGRTTIKTALSGLGWKWTCWGPCQWDFGFETLSILFLAWLYVTLSHIYIIYIYVISTIVAVTVPSWRGRMTWHDVTCLQSHATGSRDQHNMILHVSVSLVLPDLR